MLEPVFDGGASVLFVQLTCARDEHFARVQDPSRRELDKLVDPARLEVLMQHSDMRAEVPFEPRMRIDTSHLSAEATAALIARNLRTPTQPA
jgi:hypothetical protein